MKKKKAVTRSTQFKVLKGKSLDFITYRGYAPLSELARVSKADIFDQKKNATGSQRNLNKSHARAAYNYVYGGTDVFYPEFILNVRNPRIVKFKPESDDEMYGTLYFTTDPTKQRSITISRVDGNHRLWLVDGSQEGYDPIDREVPFSILIAGDIMKELKIFRDINDNQMGMNTSHLRNIDYRLRGRDVIKARNPALYIARRLQEDKKSAFYQKIHEGGRVEKGGLLSGLTTANLSGAIKDMLTRSSKLPQIGDVDAQYTLIRNYWIAVSKRLSDAWKNPSQYIIFRGMGLLLISYIGIEVIDRCIAKGKYESKDMLKYLQMIPQSYDFSTQSPLKSVGGRSGARKIAGEITSQFEEEGEISVAKLQKQILESEL